MDLSLGLLFNSGLREVRSSAMAGLGFYCI